MSQRRVSILGSTGSVGRNTVDLVARNPERFQAVALTGHQNPRLLAQQALALHAEIAVIGDERHYSELKQALAGAPTEAAAGRAAIIEAAGRSADWTMAAIIGADGLEPTLSAVALGGVVAIANKESLVCAGALVRQAAAQSGARLLPVDSEHNAIFQVLQGRAGVRRIILTASGGPFRSATQEQMRRATPEEALDHPVWSMGAKISVDSATMMNKGLEIIEAAVLFDIPAEAIDVLVHPQSVVHSLVEYVDGSILAQLGSPDMRIPIAHTLAWPERIETPAARLDLVAAGPLEFEEPDSERFPALRLAKEALIAGGLSPAILNAANEVAVAAFLERRIGFLDITKVVETVLDQIGPAPLSDLSSVLGMDAKSRALARKLCNA